MTTEWTVTVRGAATVEGTTGSVELRPKERAVVAAVAALHPATATPPQIIEMVWGHHPPSSAQKSLHNHVSRMRRSAPGLIDSDDAGYRLSPGVRLDLAGGARHELALADLADHPTVDLHRERMRIVAAELDEARLEREARHDPSPETVEALHVATNDEPYRERRWMLLARTQAQLGRRRDALLTLEQARRHLAEVGLTVGAELRRLEDEILVPDQRPAASAPRPATHLIHPHRNDPFVGRAGALDTLDGVWRAATETASPHAVVIEGPAGIGKTRLVDEFARRITSARPAVRVMWGRHREHADRAWGAIAESVDRQLAAEPDVIDSPTALDAFAAGGSAGPDTGDLGRTQLGLALTRFVRGLGGRPTIWLLDDLQWASAESMALLAEAFDGATGPLLLIGTARPERTNGGAWFGDIARSMPLHHVTIDPFSLDELAELFGAGADTPEPGAVSTILSRTAGLPLYVSELARVARLTGVLDVTAIPPAIREWLNGRLRQLPAELLDTVRLASVIGQTIDVAMLALVADRAEEPIAMDCDTLVLSGLLTTELHSGRLSFSHALTRDIVSDSIGPLARRSLHQRTAEALIHAESVDHDALAHHFAAAGDPRAAAHATLAGEASLASGAWNHAERQFGAALDTTDDPLERARALVGLGRAQHATGSADAADTLLEAADLARRHDDAIVHARAALALVGRAGRGAILDDETQQLQSLEEALAHLERAAAGHPNDATIESLRSDLERELAIAMLLHDREPEWTALFTAARDRAEEIDPPDQAAIARALLGYRYAQLGPGQLEARLANIERVLAMPRMLIDAETYVAAHVYLIEDELRAGRVAAARAAHDRTSTLLGDYPSPYWTWAARTWRFLIELIDGDLDRADATSTEALTLRNDVVEAHICRAVNSVAIDLYRGDVSGQLDTLRGAVSGLPHIPAFRAVLALCLAEAGELDGAATELSFFADAGFANLPRETNWFLATNVLAHVAATVGDHDAGAALLATLEPYADEWVVLSCYGGGGAFWGSTTHSLALLADMLGDERAPAWRTAAEAAMRGVPVVANRLGSESDPEL